MMMITYVQVEHNCVRELRAVVRDQGDSLTKAQQDLADMRSGQWSCMVSSRIWWSQIRHLVAKFV